MKKYRIFYREAWSISSNGAGMSKPCLLSRVCIWNVTAWRRIWNEFECVEVFGRKMSTASSATSVPSMYCRYSYGITMMSKLCINFDYPELDSMLVHLRGDKGTYKNFISVAISDYDHILTMQYLEKLYDLLSCISFRLLNSTR